MRLNSSRSNNFWFMMRTLIHGKGIRRIEPESSIFRFKSTFGACTSLQFSGILRAVVSNFRESGDRSENSNFFLFAPKDPFGELFSKIIFKSSGEFLFWQKLGKFEIGLNATDGPIEIMQITTFLKLSFKTR